MCTCVCIHFVKMFKFVILNFACHCCEYFSNGDATDDKRINGINLRAFYSEEEVTSSSPESCFTSGDEDVHSKVVQKRRNEVEHYDLTFKRNLVLGYFCSEFNISSLALPMCLVTLLYRDIFAESSSISSPDVNAAPSIQ